MRLSSIRKAKEALEFNKKEVIRVKRVKSRSGKNPKPKKREPEPEKDDSLDIWDKWTADVQEQLHRIADYVSGTDHTQWLLKEIGEKLDKILEANTKLRLELIAKDSRTIRLIEQLERMTLPTNSGNETNQLPAPVPTATVLEELEETL